MAPVITRQMMTSYREDVAGGVIPTGLFIQDVPKMTEFMRRMDRPMLKLVKPGGSHDKLEWLFGEGDLISRDTLTGVATTHTSTQTTLTVLNGKLFQKWFLLRIPSTGEIMLVDGFVSDNVLSVRRNWPAGGTGVALSAQVAIQILGPAIPEGADAVDSPIAAGEIDYTYPQIFEYTWTYTHRGRYTPDYEVKSDKFKYQAKKKMKEAAGDLNRMLLAGYRNKGDGTADNPSAMGGLRQFTSTRTYDANGAPLKWIDIMTLAETVAKDVGQEAMGHTIMGNFFAKSIFNSYFQKSRITNGSDEKLKMNWQSVETDLGIFKFVINYDMDDNELIIWNPEDAALDHFEGGTWTTGLYSTQGWYDRGFLRGDYGALYNAARRRMMFYDFSVDPADYPNLHVPV